MNKQRIAVLAIAVLGMTAIFMPWMELPILGGVNGTNNALGWVTFGLFALPALLSMIGDKSGNMKLGLLILAAVSGIIAALLGVLTISEFGNVADEMAGENLFDDLILPHMSPGYGLYVVIIAGVALPLFGLLLRDSRKPAEAAPSATMKRVRPVPAEAMLPKSEPDRWASDTEEKAEPGAKDTDKEDWSRFMPK